MAFMPVCLFVCVCQSVYVIIILVPVCYPARNKGGGAVLIPGSRSARCAGLRAGSNNACHKSVEMTFQVFLSEVVWVY
ncbi:MAG: hypothetical protein JOS17DRAFT_478731 [Linnemannia elongata]|nr:MAG: hypothetical protein JOS17DRAFT_478731 [Linnemannia elongata]